MDHAFSQEVLLDGVKPGNRFILAVIAGVMTTLGGVLLWLGITLLTGPQSDYLAIGLAFLIGLSVRLAGSGTGIVYGLLGAVLTLVGSFAGSMLAVVESGTTDRLDFYDVLARLDPLAVATSVVSQATPMTYTFLVVSLIIAFQLSIQKS